MVVVSLATARHIPADGGTVMIRLHAPERLAAELRSLERD
jgi:hypothetical protein